MPTRTPRIPDAALARIPGKALYRMATQGAEVVVGGNHPTLVLPEAHASKWGGECWLRVRHADANEIDRADKAAKAQGKALKTAEKASLRSEKGKPVLDIPTTGRVRRHEIREGSLKWDVVYEDASALPADGIERFQLEFPEGLTWHYQPELTPEEIAEGCERPENVVGSYAGYWNQAGRYLDKNGEEIANYETGKFAHLYRPEMVDAVGNRCWAEQELVGNELRITLPTEWMSSAVYPVTLDPTFGYDGSGASLAASGGIRGTEYNLPVNGDVESISVRWQSASSQSGYINYAIYDSSDDLVAHVGATDIVNDLNWDQAAHAAWYTISFGTKPNLTAGNYVLVGLAGRTTIDIRMRFDVVSSKRYFLASADTTPPDPFNGTIGTADFKYSIYATYEESGGGAALTILQALQANIASTGTTYADLSAGIATTATNNHDLSAAIAMSGSCANDLSSLVSTSGAGNQDLKASIATRATLQQALQAAIATEIQTSADLLLTVSELIGTVVSQDLRLSIATAQTGHADLQTSIATLAGIRQGLQLAVATSLTTLHDTSIQIAELIGTIVRQDLQLVISSELQQAQAVALSVASAASTAQTTLAAVATEQTATVPLTVEVSTLLQSLADLELRIESIVTSATRQDLRLEVASELVILQDLLVRVQDAANVLMPELFAAISRINRTFSADSPVNTTFSATSRVELRRLN